MIYNYLRHEGYVFVVVCVSVCKISQKLSGFLVVFSKRNAYVLSTN